MSENNSIWCPGCSREVEGVCHHFHCAIGPNGLEAQIRSRTSAQGAPDPEEASYDRASSVPIAWIAFAGNGNIRLWTSDEGRAKEEKERGLDLRAFTLAELVALAGRGAHTEGHRLSREWIAETIFKHMVHPEHDPQNKIYKQDYADSCAAADAIAAALAASLPSTDRGSAA